MDKSIDSNELRDEIEHIKGFNGQSIPLEELGIYYDKLGSLLRSSLETKGVCEFYMNSSVTKVIKQDNGHFQIFLNEQNQTIESKRLVIATGGIPRMIEYNTLFAGKISLKKYLPESIHSDSLLKFGIPETLKTKLKQKPKILVLGGSHSAFSAAHLLLNSKENYNFGPNDIKIWCSSPPKIYFATREEALENNYTDFTDDDFCPITKKLYRLAGLRMDGRDLYMQMLGLRNSKIEKRVELKIFANRQSEFEEDLKEAALIIVAFGYQLNMVSVYDMKGKAIKFKGEETNHWVNEDCEMLDDSGNVIPNLYATGLGTGFIPSGQLGGEPSFEGQTNGIWYYQNAIAGKILNNLQNEDSSNMP